MPRSGRKGSLFRKVALSLWSRDGDPSVYSLVDLDVTNLKEKSLLLAVLLKAIAETREKNPELNTMLRWGRIFRRSDKSISIMINIPGTRFDDLSALYLDDAHLMSVKEIQLRLSSKTESIRQERDPHLGPVLRIVNLVPQPILKFFLKIYSFMIYEVGTRLGVRFLPYRPFGSIIVSNIGSLGIKNALLPLVPLARAALLVSVGKISSEAKVFNAEICARQIVQLGVTFDHRLFDGSHAAKMLRDFESEFEKFAMAE